MVKAILFLLLSPFSCIMCNSSEVTSLLRVKNRVEIVDAVFCSKQPRLAQIKLLLTRERGGDEVLQSGIEIT